MPHMGKLYRRLYGDKPMSKLEVKTNRLNTEYKNYVRFHNKLFLKPLHDRGLLDLPFGTNKYYAGVKPLSYNEYKIKRDKAYDYSREEYKGHEKSGNVPSGRL